MKAALCGGGTGGHVYPALSIAAALRQEMANSLALLYLGAASGQETELVEQAGIPYQAVPSGPIRGRWPIPLAINAAKMGLGAWRAGKALSRFGAQVVLATGGYASIPVALAARYRGIPLVVYLPDVYPGWAVKALARLAQRVAVSTPWTLSWLPNGQAVVAGYPVRPQFWQVNRSEGRQRLGLEPEGKVIIVAGASQGARSINRAVAANLRGLLELCEVIHLSGLAEEPQMRRVRQALPEGLRARYRLFGYLHEEFPWAMAAADLALCRAGASVLGELPALGLPAVLVPYPYAGGHQRHNARYLKEQGAAIVVEDDELERRLLPLVGELLHDEARLRSMAAASRQLARPEAARDIARLVVEAAARP